MRNHLALVLLILGVFAAPRGGLAQDESSPEREVPWIGVLPDPGQDCVIDSRDAEKDLKTRKWFTVRVLDNRTGHPVRGARLTRTPESIAAERRRPDVVMSTALTNADGIAFVPVDAEVWADDSHWLVSAPGYATAYEYAVVPATEVLLGGGVRVVGRVLDALGRPVAGATVSHLGGCSHGTPAERASTDPAGVFTFDRMVNDGQFWVEAPGIRSGLVAVERAFRSAGAAPADIVMGPSARYEGRVVDLLGEPVADVVVRVFVGIESRGPVTVTRTDGCFVLEGAEPDEAVHFFPPADFGVERNRLVEDAWPAAPMTVIVTPRGVFDPGEKTAVVEIRSVRADGSAASDVSFRLVSEDTGRGPRGVTADEAPKSAADPPLGVAREQVAPGTYRVLPSEPFSRWTFDPVAVTAPAGTKVAADLAVREQPRLRVLGDVAESANVTIAIALPGRQDATIVAGETWLPADCVAALEVTPKDGPPFFFPVGPARDGFRDVRVDIPAPRRIVLPAGAMDAKLRDGLREVLAHEAADGFETWASGKLVVRFSDESGQIREASIDLDSTAAGGTVRVDPATAVVVEEKVVVRLVGLGADGAEKELERKEVAPGEMVVFRGDGERTMRAVGPASGEVVLRRGTAALRLTVRDAAGAPIDAVALVADEVYAAPTGTLALHGFDAGTVRIVVARRDHRARGVELHLVLEAGKTRERTVTLAE